MEIKYFEQTRAEHSNTLAVMAGTVAMSSVVKFDSVGAGDCTGFDSILGDCPDS